MGGRQEVGQANNLLHNGSSPFFERWERETRLFAGQGYGATREKRGTGGNSYYYTAERINGRCVKKYLGNSLYAISMAGGIIGRNIEQAQEKAKAAAARQRSDAVFAALDALGRRSVSFVALWMGAAGYHRHKRGPWRKRRALGAHKKEFLPMGVQMVASPEHSAVVTEALNDPKSARRDKAISILNDPDCLAGTNLAEDIEGFIRGFSSGSDLSQAFYRNQYRSVWREMTGTFHGSPEAQKIPAVERVLIDRVIVCRFAMVHYQSAAGKATTYHMAEQCERDIDRAQRRLLSAARSLAEIKRLALPMVNVAMPGSMQVNVGEKQINATMQGASLPA